MMRFFSIHPKRLMIQFLVLYRNTRKWLGNTIFILSMFTVFVMVSLAYFESNINSII